MWTLVIDLGHRGSYPRAIGPKKTYETNVVLAIGQYFSLKFIQSIDFTMIY